MKKKKVAPAPDGAVRPKTERIPGKRDKNPDRAPGDADARRFLHELQVHQHELEIQNEELRRIQQQLEASRSQYFDLYHMAPVGYLVLSEDGLIQEANLTAANLLGVTRGVLAKQALTRFILPEHREAFQTHWRSLFEAGERQTCELRLLRAGAAPFWARIEAIMARDADGSPACRAAVSDITDRRGAEEALRESEAKHRTLVEMSPDAVIMADLEARVTYANREAARMLGYDDPEEMIGKPANDFLAPEMHQAAAGHVKWLLDRGALRHTVFRARRRDGSLFPAECSVSPMRNEAGSPIGALVMARDITDKKRTEDERRQDYETQMAILSLLQFSLKTESLEKILTFALERILSISWLVSDGRGAIFLTNEPDTLVMAAHANLSEAVMQTCARIPFGRCLCGRAAQSQTAQFAGRLDVRHEITYPGIQPHGHYCVPILSAGKTLGVLNIYVHEGSAYRKRDERFLQVIAGALAEIIERRRAEGAWRESEGRFRTLFEQAADLILLLEIQPDAPPIIRDVNGAIMTVLGYRWEEVIGQPVSILEAMPGAAQKTTDQMPPTAVAGVYAMEVQHRCKDGAVREFECSTTETLIGGKRFAISVERDVTDRRLKEAALAESEERHRQIFQASSAVKLVVDPDDGRIVDANQAACDFYGYPCDRLRHMKIFEINQNPPDEIRRDLQTVKNSKRVFFNFPHRLASGEIRQVEVYTSPLVIDGKTYLHSIVHDVTDRRRAEEQQRASEARYRLLADNLRDIVWTMDLNLRPTYISPSVERVRGLTVEEALRQRLEEMLTPDSWRAAMAVFNEELAIESQPGADPSRMRRLELEEVLNDGSTLWTETVLSFLRDDEGRAVGILGVTRDVAERKRAVELLLKSEKQLSNAMDIAHLGHWEYDVAADLFTFNDQFYRLFHTTAEQSGGYTMSSADYARRFVHPADAAVVGEEVQKAIETTDPHFNRQIEHRVLFGDGTVGDIVVRFFVAKDAEGRTVRTFGVNQDITERKRAEDALRDSEERFRTLTENIGIGVAMISPDMEILTLNKQMRDWFPDIDPTKKPLCYRAYNDPPRDAPCSYCPTIQTLRDGRRHEATTETPTPNGIRCYRVVGTPVRDKNGAVRAAIEMVEDITEQKKASDALFQSAARWQGTFDAISDIVCILSLEHEFVEINKAGVAALGMPHDEIIGKTCCNLVHGTDAPIPQCPCVETIETSRPQSRRYSSDGRHMELSAWPMFGPDGQMGGFVHVVKDITMDIERESEKEKLQEQLRQSQKMESIGRLAGGVAHDFNNLLQVINSYAELSLAKLRDEDPLRKNLNCIYESGERAAGLTRQLLAFSRKQVLQTAILDINTTIVGMEKMMRRLIGEDIDIRRVYAPDLGKVRADPGQIEQILMNLAVNARDAMPTGGKLTIETANVELDEKFAAQHVGVTAGAYVMLAVSDTGCGMDEATKALMFEPFFTTKEKGKGTGLGLATVYGIVQQSGGSIWVYSEPGKGTSFKIYFPCDASATATLLSDKPPVKAVSGTETILVVEDEEKVRQLVEEALRSAGYAVLPCANAGEALLTCEQHQGPIHLMLTDVVMPRMSGRQLAERLSSLRPETKVLYMSGYTDNAIVHHGVLDEGTQFIGKPFTIAALASKVRDVLDSG